MKIARLLAALAVGVLIAGPAAAAPKLWMKYPTTVKWEPETTVGIGAKAGTNVTATEYGTGTLHKTVLTMAATPITLVDAGGVVLHGSQKLYDFPQGNILVLGATLDADTATGGNLAAAANGDVGVGTTAEDGDAGPLAATEQNIIPNTSIAQTVGNAGPVTGYNTAAIAPFDGTSAAVDLYLNVLWDDADHNGGTMTLTGTLTITWINLGDI